MQPTRKRQRGMWSKWGGLSKPPSGLGGISACEAQMLNLLPIGSVNGIGMQICEN